MLNIRPLNIFKENIRPYLIAGPCSAESEEQMLATAKELASYGIEVFRAGLWKPRTRPGCFEGVGERGLIWMKKIKEETGMLVATEVATPQHVEQALSADIDVLWLGARTTANPFAVQEIAEALRGCDVPVFVKNPINPDIDLWIGALQRLNIAGITRLAALHRGFSMYNVTVYRNDPQWHIPIELHRREPELMIFCDPSHIGGKKELVLPLSQQALDLQFDGLFIESHISPTLAMSDARQQVTPTELRDIVSHLVLHLNHVNNDDVLYDLRRQIDALDMALIEILAKRFDITREIGEYKRIHNMPVLQTARYNEIIENIISKCIGTNLDTTFVSRIFEAIHEQSVKEQLELNDKKNDEI